MKYIIKLSTLLVALAGGYLMMAFVEDNLWFLDNPTRELRVQTILVFTAAVLIWAVLLDVKN